MNDAHFVGLVLVIMGATLAGGIIAHDGTPVHDVSGVVIGLMCIFGGLLIGLFTGHRLPRTNREE